MQVSLERYCKTIAARDAETIRRPPRGPKNFVASYWPRRSCVWSCFQTNFRSPDEPISRSPDPPPPPFLSQKTCMEPTCMNEQSKRNHGNQRSLTTKQLSAALVGLASKIIDYQLWQLPIPPTPPFLSHFVSLFLTKSLHLGCHCILGFHYY